MARRQRTAAKNIRRTRSQDLLAAHHEAGHAVAAWRLELSIGRAGISIRPAEAEYRVAGGGRVLQQGGFSTLGKRGYKGDPEYDYPAHNTRAFERRAVVSLAGWAAQRRYNPRSVRRHHASSDLHELLGEMEHFTWRDSPREQKAYLQLLKVRAEELIDRFWPSVQAVAAALMERKRLSKDEVLAVASDALQKSRSG